MAEKIVMPQLGESVTEGTISKWLVKSGDFVRKYDPICEVITDKVNAEVPSTCSGTIGDILIEEGQTVGVGTLICFIEPEQENQINAVLGDGKQDAVPASTQAPSSSTDLKQRYSPAVLKLSGDYNIDLSQVRGTGAGGRITRKDVLSFVQNGKVASIPAGPEIQGRQTPTMTETQESVGDKQPEVVRPVIKEPIHAANGDQIIPNNAVRKTIASRMVQSKNEIPHAWTMIECDVTNLVNFREKVKEDFRNKEGVTLTYLPFFIKAVVEAIKEFPIVNSQWADDGIIVKKDINISIAVATEDALYVPVIKDADQKSVLGIAKAVNELAKKTREGRLSPGDISGGTFTVNNTGSFGSIQSAPIINHPQAAILSVESIVKRPVVINNMIAIRDMVNLCLSLDHRVLDGLVCGRFLQSIKQKLENVGPETSLY